MHIAPISKKSKSEQVYEFIVDQISNGEWPPKSRLPNETELASMFGVSRGSIRGAISLLSGQGVVSVRQGEGTFVNEVLPETYLGQMLQMVIMDTPAYLEIQEFRRVMEPMIAYIVAGNATQDALDSLCACVSRQRAAQDKEDMSAYLELDMEFHSRLAESTGNGLVIKQMQMVQDLLRRAMYHTGSLSGYRDGVEYHQEILNSLVSRDANGARDLMLRHIDNNIILLTKKGVTATAEKTKH